MSDEKLKQVIEILSDCGITYTGLWARPEIFDTAEKLEMFVETLEWEVAQWKAAAAAVRETKTGQLKPQPETCKTIRCRGCGKGIERHNAVVNLKKKGEPVAACIACAKKWKQLTENAKTSNCRQCHRVIIKSKRPGRPEKFCSKDCRTIFDRRLKQQRRAK